MSSAIVIENLSKQYRLGQIGTGTISHDLNRWWAKMRNREDPTLKIGEVNQLDNRDGEFVWALRDINLIVKEGEVLGIIGKNGAGKSTLLKILSRVTGPTTGSVKVKGRIASLLEVGTGFHPELTGKENIFLNGAILGMTKTEIKNKFDQIVDFSGVEKYIDTPVKRYSSGMYVRLAFAVAAHLDPEILVIDEVLAVGDAEFQKKCLGKMKDVAGEGRTVLFVSHNLFSVKNLCSTGILIQNGSIVTSGSSQEVIDAYISQNKSEGISNQFKKTQLEGKNIELTEAFIADVHGKPKDSFDITEDIYVHLKYQCIKKMSGVFGYITVKNSFEEFIIESDTFDYMPNCIENLNVGKNNFILKIDAQVLSHGEFVFDCCISSQSSIEPWVDNAGEILKFTVVDSHTKRGTSRIAKTSHLLKWELQNAI